MTSQTTTINKRLSYQRVQDDPAQKLEFPRHTALLQLALPIINFNSHQNGLQNNYYKKNTRLSRQNDLPKKRLLITSALQAHMPCQAVNTD
mgnify:CR=1 FL=1